MANELTLGASVAFQKGNDAEADWSRTGVQITVTGTVYTIGQVVSVGTSEEAVPLGETAARESLFFGENLDDTNYIEIRLTGTGGVNLVKVGPREPFMFRIGTAASTAPYWIAITGACLVRFGIIPK